MNKTIHDIRRDIILHGESFGVKTDDYKDAQVIYEIFVERIYDGLNIESGDVVLDIGAHIGSFTRWALNEGAEAVISVEPFPPAARTFMRQSFMAEEDVTFYNAAIAVEHGRAELRVNTRSNTFSNTTHPLRRAPDARSLTLDVDAVSLDYLLQTYHPSKIKCDCEGIEAMIFNDPLPDLTSVKRMFIEYHFNYPGMLETVQSSMKALMNYGFTMHTPSVPQKETGWPTGKLFT